MLPVITTTPLRLLNRTVSASGVYDIVGHDMVVLRLAVATSGNATPLVSTRVDWGDGNSDSTDFRSIGRQYQFQHAYGSLGNYTVTVRATNTDNETSAIVTETIIALRVIPERPPDPIRQFKWSGLALPARSIAQAYAAPQDITAPLFCGLAVATGVGDDSIYVDSLENQFTAGAQVVLTQAGKKITAARVLDHHDNLIHLDAQVLDTYTPNGGPGMPAVVEIRGQIIQRGHTVLQTQPEPWAFPVSHDKELIRASVRMAFATRQGERLWNPDYGSRLPEIPFEPNDDLTFQVLHSELQRSVNRWEPRAQVSRVSFTRDGNDIYGKCIVQIADSPETFELDFALNADRQQT